MLRKALAAAAATGSLVAAGFAVPAMAQTSTPVAATPKAPKCIAIPERKAALAAELTAANARLAALNAAKAQVAGHPRAVDRITIRIARVQGRIGVIQTRQTVLQTRCP